ITPSRSAQHAEQLGRILSGKWRGGLAQRGRVGSMPRVIGSLALLLSSCGRAYPSRGSMFTGGGERSLGGGSGGGDGERGGGEREDRSAKPGRSAGPQNKRRESSRYCHGREFEGPEAEGKRREAPREESYQGYHEAGDLGA